MIDVYRIKLDPAYLLNLGDMYHFMLLEPGHRLLRGLLYTVIKDIWVQCYSFNSLWQEPRGAFNMFYIH